MASPLPSARRRPPRSRRGTPAFAFGNLKVDSLNRGDDNDDDGYGWETLARRSHAATPAGLSEAELIKQLEHELASSEGSGTLEGKASAFDFNRPTTEAMTKSSFNNTEYDQDADFDLNELVDSDEESDFLANYKPSCVIIDDGGLGQVTLDKDVEAGLEKNIKGYMDTLDNFGTYADNHEGYLQEYEELAKAAITGDTPRNLQSAKGKYRGSKDSKEGRLHTPPCSECVLKHSAREVYLMYASRRCNFLKPSPICVIREWILEG